MSVMRETLTGEKAASSKLSSSTALLSDSAAVNLIYITQIEWGKKRVIRSRLSEVYCNTKKTVRDSQSTNCKLLLRVQKSYK